jgi:hypothetical protein
LLTQVGTYFVAALLLLLLLLRLFQCTDGFGIFRQPLNQPWSDSFGLTFGFGYKNFTNGCPSYSTFAISLAKETFRLLSSLAAISIISD